MFSHAYPEYFLDKVLGQLAQIIPFKAQNGLFETNMIHTENFVLIDKKKQIRGFYDGTDKEEINRLLVDIEILKKSN